MSSFKKVLIPTDFSAAAWHAMQLGLELVNSEGSTITLLHVFPYSAKFDRKKGYLKEKDLAALENVRGEMNILCAEFSNKTVASINPVVLVGRVEKEILDYIRSNKHDLIVMGVNSSGIDNHPGSHISNIIEQVDAPVLVVPNKIDSENLSA